MSGNPHLPYTLMNTLHIQVNEIAKFNKLQPKYVLAGEEGPPHHKTFTVILELGAEKYEGTGTSIKKAQHAAAKKVIDTCETLDRPKYKPKRPKTINMGKLQFKYDSYL